MAVALNVKGEAAADSTPASPRTVSVTVANNANRVVIGALFESALNPGTLTATFAGSAMTSLGSIATAANRRVYLFALKGDGNIPTGAGKVFSVGYTTVPQVAGVGVWVFDGASDWQNFTTSGPTTSVNESIAITSANGNMVCAAGVDDNAAGRTINGGTSDWTETAFDGNYLGSHAASVGGSTGLGWTLGSSVSWAMAGVDVIAAGGGGGPTDAQNIPAIMQAMSGGIIIGRVDA
jgi:hypothetical protein